MTKGQIEVLLDQINDTSMICAPAVAMIITDYDSRRGRCGAYGISRHEVAEVAEHFDDFIEKLVRSCMEQDREDNYHAAKALMWLAQENSDRLRWQQLTRKGVRDLIAPIIREWIKSDLTRVQVKEWDATNATFQRYVELMRFCRLTPADVMPSGIRRERKKEMRERLEMLYAAY